MTYNHDQAVKAQIVYTDSCNLPHLAPPYGYCFRCGRDLYADGGFSVEEAATHLITYCPFCHRSFAD